jgi:hypothetical protein
MKILKNILIGLGSLFILFIVFAVYMSGESSEFKEQNEQFVKDFTQNYSRSWNIESVSDLVTNDFLSQINTPNGQHAVTAFRQLGALVEIKDMELNNYGSHSSGITTGVFKFKATFEKSKALVSVTLQDQEGAIKVHGFYINPINNITTPKEIEA